MLLLNSNQSMMKTKKQDSVTTEELKDEIDVEDKRSLFFGLVFGILFGFLLHKGG